MQDEDLWEYETISIFLTNNPFEEGQQYLTPLEDIPTSGKGVCIGIVSDITKRNDKNGKQFAYIKLFSTFSILEVICWHSQFKEYQDLIKKGNQIAILLKKTDDNRLIVEKMKTYQQWLKDKKINKQYK